VKKFCRIELFGGLRVSVHDRSFERFQTQKTGALLAYLALQPGRSHSRELLAETLWPEGDPTSIRNRLNQAVSSLRRQVHPPEAPGLVLMADHFTLRVNDQLVETDVQEFMAALEAAEKTRDRQEKLSYLLAATNLYKGDLLAGYFEEWVLPQRLNLSDKYAAALRDVVRLYSRLGEPEMGIEFCIKLLQLEPHDVRTHLDLIELYDRADRPLSAVRQYDEMSKMLLMAGEPIPDEARLLRKRVDRSLSGASTPNLPKPVASIAVPTPKAPVVTSVTRDNLPHVLTRFIGRTTELAQIQRCVTNGSRLICLTGLGGIGKTRLALAAADHCKSKFDRRLVVSAFGRPYETEIAPEIRRVLLGDADIDRETALDKLAELPPTLLILDGPDGNFAETAAGIVELLHAAPKLVVFITSRMPFLVEGGVEICLHALPLPERNDTVADLVANPAVALFVDRSQAIKPDFQLTGRTAEAVANLVIQLDGIPLAIELAAGWVRTLSASQISDGLANRFDFLATARPDVPARHRSLKSAVEGSFNLLAPETQRAFIKLAGIRGNYELGFVRELFAQQEPDMILHQLISASFVVPIDTEKGVRYSAMGTVREFALELRDDAQADEDERDLVSVIRTVFRNDPSEVKYLYENVASVVDCLERHDRLDEAIEFAVTLKDYWQYEGSLEDGIRIMDHLLARNEQQGKGRIPYADSVLATLEWLSGQYDKARARLEHVVEIADEVESWEPRLALSREYHRLGKFNLAEAQYRFVMKSADAYRNESIELEATIQLGNSLVDQVRFDEARATYEHALHIARETDRFAEASSALQGLACVAMEKGQFEAATRWLAEAADIKSRLVTTWRMALLRVDQARLSILRNRPTEALDYLRAAVESARGTDLVTWRVAYAGALAYLELGEYANSAQLLGFTKSYAERHGQSTDARDVIDLHETIARCESAFGFESTREFMTLGRNLGAESAMGLVKRPRERKSTKGSTSNRRSSKIGIAA
jgi:predicted ATPase/DNA-binding SARP family transcriptional activator